MLTVCQWFLAFLFYSFAGWCCETVYCSVLQGKLVNRGFLNGPLCPVYGFGALLVIFLLRGTQQTPVALFFSGMLVTSVLEYFTSWLLEKLFHMKWWDYSHHHIQINGRVCLLNSLMFGGLSVVLMLVLHPFAWGMIEKLQPMTVGVLAGLLGGVLLADAFLTVRQLLRMRGYLEEVDRLLSQAHSRLDERVHQLQAGLDTRREELAERRAVAEEEWQEFQRQLESRRLRPRWGQRRIFHAFPHLHAGRHQEAVEKLREYWKSRK